MAAGLPEPDGANGSVIRFLWYPSAGASVSLWDAGRVTPRDESWLRLVVGLSDTLIRELKAWTQARDALGSRRGTPDDVSAVNAQAGDLVARLNDHLHPRFTTEHLRPAVARRSTRNAGVADPPSRRSGPTGHTRAQDIQRESHA
jgi:hypothetical protein